MRSFENIYYDPYPHNPTPICGGLRAPGWIFLVTILILLGLLFFLTVLGPEALAQAHLPGSDASDKLEAAGTILRIIDTGLFKWGARIFAGVCIMSSAWSLKEQRFGIAIISIIGAIIFGTAPTWVKNIFAISGSDSIFGSVITLWPSLVATIAKSNLYV